MKMNNKLIHYRMSNNPLQQYSMIILFKGVVTNNKPSNQEFNYHSGSNCDLCVNAFYN